MNPREATDLGNRLSALVEGGRAEEAASLLTPVLAGPTPFRLLDRIGQAVGAGALAPANAFLERIAAGGTMGGWVVIASALGRQIDRDPAGALARCREAIVAADVWYATDILGERVPGPALVAYFEPALALFASWRSDPNRWVRRTAGVAVHFWAKRSRGQPQQRPQAEALLAFLEPLLEERDVDAIKGVGWGLKTLGRCYPDLVAAWLEEQMRLGRRPRALMLRKARTYLAPGYE